MFSAAQKLAFFLVLFGWGFSVPCMVAKADDWSEKLKAAKGKEFVALANKVSALGIESSDVQKVLVERLNSEDINSRAASVDALPYVGEMTPEIISAIFDSMNTNKYTLPDGIPYTKIAVEAIVKCGTKAMPEALKRIDSQDRFIYGGTMDYLHQMGPKSKEAVPKLVKNLTPGKNFWPTVYALEGIGKDSKPALDKLIDYLDSDDFNVVCIASRAIGSIGPEARKAKAKLLEILENGNVSERGQALKALGGIGVANEEDVKKLIIDNLSAFHQSICDRAMMGIGMLTPEKSQQFVESVEKAIERPAYKNKPLAALTLYKIGGSQNLALKTLEDSLTNPVFEVDVFKKFGEIGPDARDSLHVLMPYLNSEDDYLRALAIETIAKIEVDELVLGEFRKAAENGGYLAKRAAKWALKDLNRKE